MLKSDIIKTSVGVELDKLCAELVFGSNLTKGFHNYSTNIAHAWLVYEHLRTSGNWCCLNLHSDHHYIWRFTLKCESDHEYNTNSVSVTAKTAPEAIVKVAILSVL
jgi:hypothetical protein